MSVETLKDFLAQASVDGDLEAKLVSAAYSIEEVCKVAADAGYNISKDDISSLSELSETDLASISGGFTGYDDKNKAVILGLLKA